MQGDKRWCLSLALKARNGLDGKVGVTGKDSGNLLYLCSVKTGASGHIGLTGPAGTNGIERRYKRYRHVREE